jgi:hypothetical protein
MCSHAEWENLRRKVEGVDERAVREFFSDAAARIDALIDEFATWACRPENEWIRRQWRGRPGPEWI